MAMAQSSQRTLIIDADLRKSNQHRTFGLECDPGLCQVARGEIDLASAVRKTGIGSSAH